jgi:PAS domain S-box-containing protein
MGNRIKQAFKNAYGDNQFQYHALEHAPGINSGYSSLAIVIMVLGWVAFFTYIFVLVNVSDFGAFLETSLSPDSEGIRYRALLFFTPLIFTVIGYLVNKNDRSFRRILAYQDKLVELAQNLDQRVREQTQNLEESNAAIKSEMDEKKKALRSLLLLEKAVRTMNTGITFKDTRNIIRFINEADARMHGYEPSELIGKNAGILTSSGKTNILDTDKLKKIKSWTRESVNIHKDGSTFPVLLISDAVLDDSGEPLGTVTTCQDITDLIETKETLRDALQEKETLSRKLQHLSSGDKGS